MDTERWPFIIWRKAEGRCRARLLAVRSRSCTRRQTPSVQMMVASELGSMTCSKHIASAAAICLQLRDCIIQPCLSTRQQTTFVQVMFAPELSCMTSSSHVDCSRSQLSREMRDSLYPTTLPANIFPVHANVYNQNSVVQPRWPICGDFAVTHHERIMSGGL